MRKEIGLTTSGRTTKFPQSTTWFVRNDWNLVNQLTYNLCQWLDGYVLIPLHPPLFKYLSFIIFFPLQCKYGAEDEYDDAFVKKKSKSDDIMRQKQKADAVAGEFYTESIERCIFFMMRLTLIFFFRVQTERVCGVQLLLLYRACFTVPHNERGTTSKFQ